jgi:hypothetical protein
VNYSSTDYKWQQNKALDILVCVIKGYPTDVTRDEAKYLLAGATRCCAVLCDGGGCCAMLCDAAQCCEKLTNHLRQALKGDDSSVSLHRG